jgi:hypothetical protein
MQTWSALFCLFIYGRFKRAVSSSHHITSNDKMISEYETEGSGCDLTSDTIPELVWEARRKPRKPSGWIACLNTGPPNTKLKF